MAKYHFNAVIFDLDGVITQTASVHSAAWKKMFDEFLSSQKIKNGKSYRPFSHTEDYLVYIDGKPRYDGVASFLRSREIKLPFGDPFDLPQTPTVCGLGNRKNEIFNEIVRSGKVRVFSSTIDFIKILRKRGIHTAVASSSKNCQTILDATGLSDLFEVRVDGLVSAELGLKGKPAPDIFTTACDNLKVPYDKAVVVEDAVSGVQAARDGNFGLVIGIARENNERELKVNGADIVVSNLQEINLQTIENWFLHGLEEEKWSLVYNDFSIANEGMQETLCTVGNGYFGTRGAWEEASANDIHYPGTYIAGIYNRLESVINGQTFVNEDLVNCPNWLPVQFKIGNNDWLQLENMKILQFRKKLDFRSGLLTRTMVIEDSLGQETLIESYRFASMANPHLAALKYQVTPLNYSADITIRTSLDDNVINSGVQRYRQLNSKHLLPLYEDTDQELSILTVKTSQSNIEITEIARMKVSIFQGKSQVESTVGKMPGAIFNTFKIQVKKRQTVTLEKIVGIYTSQDLGKDDALTSFRKSLEKCPSFEEILHDSTTVWADIWDNADIQIEGDRLCQKLIRLNLYHTLITSSPHHKYIDAGIPARGLHGEAYRGHIFWDELFILPLYNFHFPEIAKSVLLYRFRRLESARRYAAENGEKGAMFPWQSGSEGMEETQILHLNPLSGKWDPDYSSLQRHVSLAIALNIWGYYLISGDHDFLIRYGAEIFLEICRFWAGKAEYNSETERYEIKNVMGPDEYHEKYPNSSTSGLNNNAYTNLMTVWALRKAFEILEELSAEEKKEIFKRIGLTGEELNKWQEIATHIYLPLLGGILEQYDGYFKLKELDWEAYRTTYGVINRLDRILKAEGKTPNGFKVSKQPDTLMIFYNLALNEILSIIKSLGYEVDNDFFEKNFDYYFQRTSHGSTLSKLVHAYLATQLGKEKIGFNLFLDALKSDYIDIQGGTTREGIHTGVMAGSIVMILKAFGGVQIMGRNLTITPFLPHSWRNMRFNIKFRGNRYYFDLNSDEIRIKRTGAVNEVIDITIQGQEIALKNGVWKAIKLKSGMQYAR